MIQPKCPFISRLYRHRAKRSEPKYPVAMDSFDCARSDNPYLAQFSNIVDSQGQIQ